jgi:hypothetical protein
MQTAGIGRRGDGSGVLKLLLLFAVLVAAACTPGSPEYGPCAWTPDCQVELVCVDTGGLLVNDAGNTYADAGTCRRTCTTTFDCQPTSEICGTNGFCSSDGGY